MASNKIPYTYRNDILTCILAVVSLSAVILLVDIFLYESPLIKWTLQTLLTLLFGSFIINHYLLVRDRLHSQKSSAEYAIKNLSDGVMLITEDYNIILISNSARNYVSEMPDFSGNEINDIQLPSGLRKLVKQCIETGSPIGIEIATQKSNQRVLKATGIHLDEKPDEKDCVLVSIADITETKKMEKRQRDGISNFSHELKTPIAAIRISAETLINGALNDPTVSDKFLGNIVDECDRLALFIENMMRIARFDSGSLTFSRQNTNVGIVVKSALRILRTHIEKKSINIDVNIPEYLVFSLDEYYLSIAIKNLIDNAVKYSSSGSDIHIKADVQHGELLISIEDHGIGIPQGETENIFDRFYRLDKARTYQAGGSGLGLAIVKKIVELHNGQVSVVSTLGKGSIFTIRIPPEI